VADIDGSHRRVHIRDGKGGKDRNVPLPALTLQAMRRFWSCHSNTTTRYAHITKVVRDHTGDRIETLLSGFQLRWVEEGES
jgi:site-specific recombinase XerD